MFNNKKNKVKIDEIDTVIGPGSEFKGDLEATGIVRVDGSFFGRISSKGDVIIGEDGNVQGEVIARNVMIAGNVEATVTCTNKLEIKASGKLMGNCTVSSIEIDEGAIFKGQCEMTSSEKSKDREMVNAG